VKSLATQADATATFAESQSQLRLAKFPPDPEGVAHAAESRAKQQQSQEQSQKADREFEQASQKLVQKKQDLEDARGLLERAEADYHDKAQKGLDCAAKASTREVEFESARARHEEAAAQLADARAVLARTRAFYQQQEQLYLDRKALEEKLSAEQTEAQSALDKAKKAVAAAAENVTGSRQHLTENTCQLHLSRKRADNARIGASTSRGNQAWSAVAEEQARLQSMLAADHSLALQEGWALHRAAHDGVSLARAATLEQVVDEERAFACAARNADVASAEAAELDFRADFAEREAVLLGVSPIAQRWRSRRFDAGPLSSSASYPTVCFMT
jgi:chromosome segregation ATPase